MNENEERVEEQPATHKKKLQLWIGLAIGVVMLILIAMIANNVFDKINEKNQEQEDNDTQVTETDDDSREQFRSLVDGRRVAGESQMFGTAGGGASSASGQATQEVPEGVEVYTPGGPLPSERDEAIKDLEDKMSQVIEYLNEERNSSRGNDNDPQTVVADFAAAELRRSLEARRADWNFSMGQGGGDSASAPGGGSSNMDAQLREQMRDLKQPFNSDPSNNDARRREVSERIQKVQELREMVRQQASQHQSEFAQDRAKVEQARQELESNSQQFEDAPQGIVGYTDENKYNADVSGKMKLPIGTVINFTSQWKANSDYLGAPMKGTIGTDIYDATNTYVLIPKGSQIMIEPYRAASANEILASRMGFRPTWIILPDGDKIDLSSSSVMDREGIGAVEGEVDRHILAQVAGVAAYAMVGSSTSRTGTGDGESSYAGDVGEGMREQVSPLAQKYLNVVPTVKVDGGLSMRLITTEEIFVEPWRDVYEDYYTG